MLNQKAKGIKVCIIYVMISHFKITLNEKKNKGWEIVHQNVNGGYI